MRYLSTRLTKDIESLGSGIRIYFIHSHILQALLELDQLSKKALRSTIKGSIRMSQSILLSSRTPWWGGDEKHGLYFLIDINEFLDIMLVVKILGTIFIFEDAK
jgi:hypothetical protein